MIPEEGGEYWDGKGWRREAPLTSHGRPRLDPMPGGTPPAQSRAFIVVMGVVMTIVLVGAAALGFDALGNQNPADSLAASAASPDASPSPASTPAARPTAHPKSTTANKTQHVATPAPRRAVALTANLSGTYCPVAYVGDTACWRGVLHNTGPRIGRLAMIFTTGSGYTNWFTTHTGHMLSGFYTTRGCTVDPAHARILCGSVAPRGSVGVYLVGGVSRVGTYNYGVKFADVSSGKAVYIDQHPNGTHDIIAWREAIVG